MRPRCVSGLLVGGLVVGLLTGVFGGGGGFLIVPLLLALSPISMAQAVSTSLMIIALVSSAGFASHLMLSDSNWSALVLVALGGIAGMMLGQPLSHKIANALLQKLFSASLLAVVLIALVHKVFFTL